MLLTITTTAAPATDLGYLLGKNPARVQTFELAFGKAHVFYPEASEERCTAALLLEIDPVGLVRGKHGPAGEGGALEQHVNDRPYVASSFLSVAISRVFGSALGGRSKERPELAQQAIPLVAGLSVVPCRGGEKFLRRLFEPLGYQVTARPHSLDDYGQSRYFTVTLAATRRLSELLTHLYVLIPVLDDDKHYWVGHDEVEKLLEHGAGWLESHPERGAIARRYLAHQKSLATAALDRLTPEEAEEAPRRAEQEVELEKPLSLNEQRSVAVIQALEESGAARVLDLGCGEGKLLRAMLATKQFTEIVGIQRNRPGRSAAAHEAARGVGQPIWRGVSPLQLAGRDAG
jgi:3' terminal RNA ribose 2'-O-methyltransferase Hen1